MTSRTRRVLATLALATTLIAGPAAHADPARQARPPTRADWAAIARLGAAWQAWLAGLAATPYTGPECPGRWAIPPRLVFRESRCLFHVVNQQGSSAAGAYQMIRSSLTWALDAAGLPEWIGTPGAQLPPWVQHRAAAALWANSPCHWAPNPWCA